MKKLLLITAVLGFTALGFTATAQNDKGIKGDKGDKEQQESQEIIIRKKGDKDTKITVEIKGDKITINGKPLSEFKDDEITINKRNIIIREGKGLKRMDLASDYYDGLKYWNYANDEPRGFLGVTTEKTDDGAKITEVTKESAAEKAGLKAGDIITKVGDKKVDDPESLYDAISSMKPKDDVKVYYNRDGKESSANAILGERKISNTMAYSFSGPNGITRSFTVLCPM